MKTKTHSFSKFALWLLQIRAPLIKKLFHKNIKLGFLEVQYTTLVMKHLLGHLLLQMRLMKVVRRSQLVIQDMSGQLVHPTSTYLINSTMFPCDRAAMRFRSHIENIF